MTFGTDATAYLQDDGSFNTLLPMVMENRAKMKNFVAATSAFGGTSMERGFEKVRERREEKSFWSSVCAVLLYLHTSWPSNIVLLFCRSCSVSLVLPLLFCLSCFVKAFEVLRRGRDGGRSANCTKVSEGEREREREREKYRHLYQSCVVLHTSVLALEY